MDVEVEVRYAETDAMGFVHHSVYLVWFELARTRLCARTGVPYHRIEEMGWNLVVTGSRLRYARPSHYGDVVRVHCRLDLFASRKLGFAYEVVRGDETLVTGETEHVWVERATGRPVRIPQTLRPSFESLAGLRPPDGSTPSAARNAERPESEAPCT